MAEGGWWSSVSHSHLVFFSISPKLAQSFVGLLVSDVGGNLSPRLFSKKDLKKNRSGLHGSHQTVSAMKADRVVCSVVVKGGRVSHCGDITRRILWLQVGRVVCCLKRRLAASVWRLQQQQLRQTWIRFPVSSTYILVCFHLWCHSGRKTCRPFLNRSDSHLASCLIHIWAVILCLWGGSCCMYNFLFVNVRSAWLKKKCFNGDSLKQKDGVHSCILKHVKTFIAVTTEPLVSGSAKSHFNKRSFIKMLLPLELSLFVFWRVSRRTGRDFSWSGMKTRSQMWLTWRKESTPPECQLKQQQRNLTRVFCSEVGKKLVRNDT